MLFSSFEEKKKVPYIIVIPYTLKCEYEYDSTKTYEYHSAKVDLLLYKPNSNQENNYSPADVKILGFIPNERTRETTISKKASINLSLNKLLLEIGFTNSVDYTKFKSDILVEKEDFKVTWFFQQFQDEKIPCGTRELVAIIEAPLSQSTPKILISATCKGYKEINSWQERLEQIVGSDKELCEEKEKLVDIPYKHLNFYESKISKLTQPDEKDYWIFEDEKNKNMSIHVMCPDYDGTSCPEDGLNTAILKIYNPDGLEMKPDNVDRHGSELKPKKSDNVVLITGGGQSTLSVKNLPSSGQYIIEVKRYKYEQSQTGRYNIYLMRAPY